MAIYKLRSTFNGWGNITSHDKGFVFAINKEAGGFYSKGSPLRGDYFVITGKMTLKTNRGSVEILTLKKIK